MTNTPNTSNSDFPGMPDAFGELFVTLLGAFLFLTIIGIPLLWAYGEKDNNSFAKFVWYASMTIITIIVILFVIVAIAVLNTINQ